MAYIVLNGKTVGGVEKVNGKTGEVTLDASDVSAIPTTQKGAASGVASLGSDGKVPAAQLPDTALTSGVTSVNGKSGAVTLGASDVSAIPVSDKGAANGVASLGSDGKVPAAQLPSYVDDVLEYANKAAFPATGETGKLYVALDTNLTWRFSGSTYVNVGGSNATVEIAGGGTGATDAATARANLAVVGGGTQVKDIAVVSALPSNPAATTLYFVTG